MKKATTEAAAKTLKMTGAKITKISEIEEKPLKKSDGIFLSITVGSVKPRKPRYTKPQAVKELEELADIENQRKHPHTPAKYLGKSKYRDDSANGLTRCIIDYIRLHGGQAERVNTMGVPIDHRRQVTDVLGHSRRIGSVEWRKGGGTVGSADISAVINGKAVKTEVKIGRDRQSEAQKAYQKQVEAAGGLYYVARDFTSFVQWYHQNFE
jgi:hypothetical protein